MKRKVFATVQVMCDSYETKFNEKVATASFVNVLIAEALTARGLIPKDYIQTEYGTTDPIKEGFTATARRETSTTEQHKDIEELARETKFFKAILESEWEAHPSIEWRKKIIARAEKWPQIECARLIVELHKGVVCS
jgi:hypothetical protein